MSTPKHLWSGDWELDSAARRDELAAGHAPAEEPVQPEPDVPPRRPRRSVVAAMLSRLRHLSRRVFSRRGRRVALVVLAVAVLGAGAAYAVASSVGGTAPERPASVTTSGSQPWVGVHVAGAPYGGALVVSVAPGSPAAAAGIEPGDVITQIDTQPIPTGSTFVSAIAGMQPGERVEIQLQRGPSTYTTEVTLVGHPAGNP
jgi:hypothetical protein